LFILKRHCLKGADINAGAAGDTALRHAALHVLDGQNAYGADKGACPAAGAFQEVDFYNHLKLKVSIKYQVTSIKTTRPLTRISAGAGMTSGFFSLAPLLSVAALLQNDS
jgi:hypothetical protein